MHMSDALLSPTVGLTMCAVSAGALAVSAARVQRSQLTRQKLPMMAVGGAFVFAAQMINFTIPGTGSSGHIGGGILLATLLGGGPALLALAAVLVVQCLFFADGGDDRICFRHAAVGDDGGAGFDDTSFGTGYVLDGVPQHCGMIQSQGGDDGRFRSRDDVGGVQRAA